jgi:uncharacterized membrane protein
MAKVPVQLVVAAYRDEEAADQVADALKQAKQQGQIYYQNVAVVRKNPEGKVKIKETGDMGAAPGAGIGAVAGGALGLLAGPAGLVAGAAVGAVIGGVGAALHDAGIPDDRLEEIGDVLGPGNSAFIGIFDQVKVDKEVMAEVDQSAAEAVEALAADIGSTLQAGQDVAYVFAVTEEGVVARREAAGEGAADIEALVVTPEGVLAGAAVATEEGVAYEVAAATEDAIVAEHGVVTEDVAAVEGFAASEGGVVAGGAVATDEGAVAGAVVATPEEEGEEDEKET